MITKNKHDESCFFDVFFRRGARFSVTRLQKVKEGKGGLISSARVWLVGLLV